MTQIQFTVVKRIPEYIDAFMSSQRGRLRAASIRSIRLNLPIGLMRSSSSQQNKHRYRATRRHANLPAPIHYDKETHDVTDKLGDVCDEHKCVVNSVCSEQCVALLY